MPCECAEKFTRERVERIEKRAVAADHAQQLAVLVLAEWLRAVLASQDPVVLALADMQRHYNDARPVYLCNCGDRHAEPLCY